MSISKPECSICGIKFYEYTLKRGEKWRILHRRKVKDLQHPKEYTSNIGLYCPTCLSKSTVYCNNYS